nr:hypothetical protein [Tanacetum cinerariifolium]
MMISRTPNPIRHALSTSTKPPRKGRGKGKDLMSKKVATPAPEKKKNVPTMKGSITAEENILFDSNEALKLRSMKVFDKPKGKSAAHDKNDDDWGSNEEEVILSSDDERTKSQREVAESDKADDETDDDEEVHDEDRKSEKEKDDNEQTGDDQAEDDQTGTFISMTHKKKPKISPLSFSLSLSSDYVSDFINLRIKTTIREVLQNTLAFLAQSSSTPGQSSSRVVDSLSEYELKKILFDKMDKSRSYMIHDTNQDLYDALLNSMCLDEAIASGEVNPEKVLRKRYRDEDQDPPTGSNKEKKRIREREEFDPPKKSSKSKESSKGRSCTSERAEVYYEYMEPFKSLMCLWVRSRSIAAIWLEKVVAPLIKPAIKGFAAASAVLKPRRLKVDKARYE